MENKLFNLFDFQRFEKNPKLAAIIDDVESRYSGGIYSLSDDDLGFVNAAGDVNTIKREDLTDK